MKISFLAPFTSKSAYFYEIIRPKGAKKQAVSVRNGPEKQSVSLSNRLEKKAVSFCNGPEKQAVSLSNTNIKFGTVTET